MNVFMLILALLFTLLLIVISGISVTPSVVSRFELKRRSRSQDSRAAMVLEREERLEDIATVLWIKRAGFLVVVTIFAIAGFGWVGGVLYALVVAVTYGAIARTSVIRSLSAWTWKKVEGWTLTGIEKVKPLIRTLRVESSLETDLYRRFDSRQELEHLITQSGSILSTTERLVLSHGLQFADVKVSDVMTPRAAIDSINKDEFLGPLVLDELHSLGHSRLPVIDEDLDHVVGILHIRDLLSLNNKESVTAEGAMEAKVYYIHQDDGLEHALAAFLKTRRHLFIVINEQRETVGLLSLEDVIEKLIGRKIMDEDDNHEDLRAIATQRGQSNNRPSGHVDL